MVEEWFFTEEHKSKIVNIVKKVEGISEVQTEIVIKPGASLGY